MTTLVKRDGGLNLLPEFPSLFNEPFLKNWLNWNHDSEISESSTLPGVNIHETADSYEMEVAAPGMNKNDFKVELQDNRLVISAERKTENEKKQSGNYLRREFSYHSFVRSFTLAEKQVEREKISARYTDGILHITVPKTQEAKTKASRVIPIS